MGYVSRNTLHMVGAKDRGENMVASDHADLGKKIKGAAQASS
jgi:hypothetical protein